ncbi:circadian locomoter output cycles protein kaput [Trichonephila inaurata madagascariensis]|uniref:Circadian locomoter output cycles protein kaput n=1 Tax=Trichonephila inaurata madagascariensis TaxID=2747483 RepID=A0A8X6WRT0_9ARAC|nr:circadian locomoter output cycles protein kaput [Trichonephila inaurata madagascariensis]
MHIGVSCEKVNICNRFFKDAQSLKANTMDEKDEFRRYTSRYKTEKIKSRNLSEKKRRDQFNMLINELCSMVTSSNRKMDKSSVLRSTISFLKNHSELSVQSQSVKVQENWKPSFLSNEEFTHLMLEALDGFIIVFSCNGQILYTSESTASLLGYLPSRIYSSVFDIIHEMDKSSLYKLISSPPSSSNNSISKDSFVSLTLHMKRGPIHSQGSSSYELVQLLGTFYHWPSSYEGSNSAAFDCDSNSCSSICSMPSAGGELRSCFVAVGRLQTPHLLRVVNLSDETKNEFTSRHSLEWKFLFLDHRAPPIIGYLPFEVLGTSGYDYYHVDDLDNISASHELLMNTGEGTSCFYRFLTKGQQWIWLQTRYYISYHQWNSKPEFIVCTHTVVSTEKVLKSIQEMPKRFLKKTSSNHNSSPTQSACLSPSPSISSLGSLSSDPLEQASAKSAGSSNVRMNTVLYPREKLMPSPISRAPPPPLADSFAEPHPHITPHHQVSQGVSSDMNAISSTGPAIISPQSNHISPDHSTPLPPPLMSPDVSVGMPQFQGERSPSAVNQVQMHEYLRRRHQILQQQIMAQQEELRRVSEQLMLVQFANPNAVPSAHIPDIQYQQVNDMNPDMGNYVNASYQTSRPTTQQMKAPTSAENIGMKSMDNYSRPTHNTVTSRSYMNLEADMCGVGTSNRMPLLSSEQTSEAIAQGYSMTHSMQSNT